MPLLYDCNTVHVANTRQSTLSFLAWRHLSLSGLITASYLQLVAIDAACKMHRSVIESVRLVSLLIHLPPPPPAPSPPPPFPSSSDYLPFSPAPIPLRSPSP
mmetsp:Transcript_34854/g.57647  ORF Transcript_34854/g.57647 Transcript_34854/m.57647 type:complete len:102 (+) Transcript_34854:257-562(+)